MPGVNRVTLLGHVGQDATMRYTAKGTAQATFSLATTHSRKDANGEWQNETTWHNIVMWGKAAEAAVPVCTKGTLVFLEGMISNRSWTGDDGVKKYRSEVVASFAYPVRGDKAGAGSGQDASDLPWE